MTSKRRGVQILQGPVEVALRRMMWPATWGLGSVITFGVIDLFFVGQLGTDALAAMSFILPIHLGVISMGVGLGIGSAAAIGAAIGADRPALAKRLTGSALLLALAIALACVTAGALGSDLLLTWLGASQQLQLLIGEYLKPYALAAVLIISTMVANGALRATGDVKTPSTINALTGLLNVGLDPLLIFGGAGLPALGIAGAAWASVLSRLVALAVVVYLLSFRRRLLAWGGGPLRQRLQGCWSIVQIALPAIGNRLLTPVTGALLTKLAAPFGASAVAALGTGVRLEGIALVGINAMGVVLVPFIAQNRGAQQWKRARQGLRHAVLLSAVWGIGAAALLCGLAPWIALLFGEAGSETVRFLTDFLRVIPLSYALVGASTAIQAGFDAYRQPARSISLALGRLFVCVLPAAAIGASFGLFGLWVGLACGQVLAALAAGLMMQAYLRAQAQSRQPGA